MCLWVLFNYLYEENHYEHQKGKGGCKVKDGFAIFLFDRIVLDTKIEILWLPNKPIVTKYHVLLFLFEHLLSFDFYFYFWS